MASKKISLLAQFDDICRGFSFWINDPLRGKFSRNDPIPCIRNPVVSCSLNQSIVWILVSRIRSICQQPRRLPQEMVIYRGNVFDGLKGVERSSSQQRKVRTAGPPRYRAAEERNSYTSTTTKRGKRLGKKKQKNKEKNNYLQKITYSLLLFVFKRNENLLWSNKS